MKVLKFRKFALDFPKWIILGVEKNELLILLLTSRVKILLDFRNFKNLQLRVCNLHFRFVSAIEDLTENFPTKYSPTKNHPKTGKLVSNNNPALCPIHFLHQA
jgi:hypothetical protein